MKSCRFSTLFTPDEIKERLAFEAELAAHPDIERAFEKEWFALVETIQQQSDQNPESPIAIAIAERFMVMVDGLYGKRYAHLRTKELEEGFCKGQYLEGTGLTQEAFIWLAKAIDAYRKQQVHHLLRRIEQEKPDTLRHLWTELLETMYGYHDNAHKSGLYASTLQDSTINEKAKAWLVSHLSSIYTQTT